MDVSKVFDWIKLKPKYLAPISVAGAATLFAPSWFIEKLGLQRLQTDFRLWVGIVFLISSVLLISHALSTVWSFGTKKIRERSNLGDMQKRLHNLSAGEKKVLRGYILNNTKSQTLDYLDGVANGLEAAKVIFRAASIGSMWGGFAYNIQPWAWDYLNANPHLLD